MKLEIQIKSVVISRDIYSFIAVQIEYDDKNTPSQKYRTDVSTLTNRPNYQRNLFSFDRLIEKQKLRFGLMNCQDSSQNSVNNSSIQGIASFSISLEKLKSLSHEGHSQILKFAKKGRQIGQFQCIIKFYHQAKDMQNLSKSTISKYQFASFNPLISRILYSQEVAKDELRLYNNMKQLQKQNASLFTTFSSLKTQEQYYEALYTNLLKDEQQLRQQIQITQKISQKLAIKLNQRQNLQSLKLQIDMLSTTQQGKRLLMQKSEYFDERIMIQNQQYLKLSQRYNNLHEQIDKRIERVEDYRNKLKGKEMQQFQLKKNQNILQSYDNIEYQYNCNKQIITNLLKKTKNSQMSAQQAALILSQVQFQIKLQSLHGQSYSSNKQKMLQLIQKEARLADKGQNQNLGQQQKFVLQIKFNALNEEIDHVKNKIRQIMLNNKLVQSVVKKF